MTEARWKIYASEPPRRRRSPMLRTATLVIGGLDMIGWLFLAQLLFLSTSDPATKGLDTAFGWAVTALFGGTTLPGLVLAALDRAPRTALSLAIAFPAVFVLLFGALVIAFAM